MITKILLFIGVASLFAMAFTFGIGQKKPAPAAPVSAPEGSEEIFIAGGCFWCVEAIFEELQGVYAVESGYAGGRRAGVSYEDVLSGMTGHAEVVRVIFDPKETSAGDLLRLFFVTHDPTTLNRQGPDAGTQYRSAIFYRDDAEKALAEKIRLEIANRKLYKSPIVTTVEPLLNYTRAEEYHQNYFAKYEKASPAQRMTMNSGYCSAVVAPKVIKFRKEYTAKLKKKS